MDDGVTDLIEEGVGHAEQTAVARGAAQQAAQDVAPALIGGAHAVGDHHGGRADMVSDDTQGNVLLVALAVVGAGDLADLVGDIHHGVHVKEGVHLLADAGQALQAHAGVNVLLCQLGIVALSVVVKLGEDDVPDLDIAVAVAADGAARLAAALLRAAVVVDLGAGAAGAGAVLPEVVLLAELEDAVLRDADHLMPDAEGLLVGGRGLVAGENGGVEPVWVQADPLRAGQELPGKRDGLGLEVVAKGEVAQHLKIGAVAGGVADVLDVAGADALLAGGHPAAGRHLLAGEPRLHRRHAGVNEQQRGVVLRDEGEAGQAEMALALKEAQEHLPQLVQTVGGGFLHVDDLHMEQMLPVLTRLGRCTATKNAPPQLRGGAAAPRYHPDCPPQSGGPLSSSGNGDESSRSSRAAQKWLAQGRTRGSHHSPALLGPRSVSGFVRA